MKKLLSRKDYEQLLTNLPVGYCPFCNLDEQIILGYAENWTWIASLSPYWKYHTLLIPKRHISDISEVDIKEFTELKKLYKKIIKHLLSLGLKHRDGKKMDQFIFMSRFREGDSLIESTYPKPDHLHLHLIPDKEGVSRFVIDESAVDIDIESIAIKSLAF